MSIDIDASFAIQIASFLLLWVVLRRLLFEPMLEVLENRERRTVGAHREASQMHSDVAAMRADYEEHVRRAREKSVAELEASRKVTAAEERTILGAARDQASAVVGRARADIALQVAAARDGLRDDATTLARQMVAKVIGTPRP